MASKGDAGYVITVPRWTSVTLLLFGIVFGIYWIMTAWKSSNYFLAAIGVLIIFVWVGTAGYTVVTGHQPNVFKRK
jgi:hypothetical protein